MTPLNIKMIINFYIVKANEMQRYLSSLFVMTKQSFREKLWLSFVILIFALMTIPINAIAENTESKLVKDHLIINSGSSAPLTINGNEGFYPELVKELFKRLQLKVVVKRMQSANSLKVLNHGHHDGVIARVKGIEKVFENLTRVPEKVIELEFVAYSNDKNINSTQVFLFNRGV